MLELCIHGLTAADERFLSESGGDGSSSSLEKASRVSGEGCAFWEVSSFRYSCTYTSLVGLPLGRSTLWASSSLFSLSLVRTDGSSRYSGMLWCGWRDRGSGELSTSRRGGEAAQRLTSAPYRPNRRAETGQFWRGEHLCWILVDMDQ